jgi:uncharacterized protein YhbP (UPF0306 family)
LHYLLPLLISSDTIIFMELKEFIIKYLKETRVMQLATTVDNQPWVCNVHFYSDAELNLYWISDPTRRHSQEIAQNPKVAATIKVHEDTVDEPYVIGVSLEGEATFLDDEETKKIANQYISKLNKAPTLLQDMLEGKNAHKFYRLKPSKLVLFDTKNFPNNSRQALML